jgi:hypothetical protein
MERFVDIKFVGIQEQGIATWIVSMMEARSGGWRQF